MLHSTDLLITASAPVVATPPHAVLLHLHGDLDLASADLGQQLSERAGTGRSVVLDLSDVSFVDCAGLGALAAAQALLARQGAALVLRSPSGAVQRLLAITGLGGRFGVVA